MAEEWSRKIEYELDRDTYLPEHKPTTYHTVSELIDVYCERILPQSGALTQRKSRYRLSWWRDVLGDTNVLSVTTAMFEEYKHMLSKRLANGTVNLYLRTLSPVFTFAASPRLGWIPRSPVQDVRLLPVKGRMPLVTNDEIQRLLDCCMQSRSKYLHLYVRLILATGCRRSEAINVRWKLINFRKGTVTFLNTKNKEDRVVPIEPETLDILKYHHSLVNNEDNWYLFDPGHKIFPQTGFWSAWDKARKRALLPHIRLHDCRHITASKLAEAGADIATIAQILGHKQISSTMRYRHLTESHTAPILEKMADAVFKKKA
jgi:integrase